MDNKNFELFYCKYWTYCGYEKFKILIHAGFLRITFMHEHFLFAFAVYADITGAFVYYFHIHYAYCACCVDVYMEVKNSAGNTR